MCPLLFTLFAVRGQYQPPVALFTLLKIVITTKVSHLTNLFLSTQLFMTQYCALTKQNTAMRHCDCGKISTLVEGLINLKPNEKYGNENVKYITLTILFNYSKI